MAMMTDFQFKPAAMVPDGPAQPEREITCPVSEAEAWDEGMVIRNLSAWYGSFQAIRDVDLLVGPKRVTAVIGPSGCGKSTLIRCLNRMHEVAPNARVAGQVYLRSDNIYGNGGHGLPEA
jgi:phosphate transport system ATP-binding protein